MHLIIAGAARSGKTTLSLMLSGLGYTHYKMDSIKRGICEAYSLVYEDWEELSPIMCKIINRVILDTNTDITYNKINYLFDIPFLYPKDISLIDTQNTLVIFLGYADISAEQNFDLIRKYDTGNVWTTKASDETLKKWCYQNVEFSKYLKRECKKYNIPYFDVSFNRTQALNDIKKYIISHMNK